MMTWVEKLLETFRLQGRMNEDLAKGNGSSWYQGSAATWRTAAIWLEIMVAQDRACAAAAPEAPANVAEKMVVAQDRACADEAARLPAVDGETWAKPEEESESDDEVG